MEIKIKEAVCTEADYRGYRIIAGTVYDPSGEPVLLAFIELSPTPEQAEEAIAEAKAWIDHQLDG